MDTVSMHFGVVHLRIDLWVTLSQQEVNDNKMWRSNFCWQDTKSMLTVSILFSWRQEEKHVEVCIWFHCHKVFKTIFYLELKFQSSGFLWVYDQKTLSPLRKFWSRKYFGLKENNSLETFGRSAFLFNLKLLHGHLSFSSHEFSLVEFSDGSLEQVWKVCRQGWQLCLCAS